MLILYTTFLMLRSVILLWIYETFFLAIIKRFLWKPHFNASHFDLGYILHSAIIQCQIYMKDWSSIINRPRSNHPVISMLFIEYNKKTGENLPLFDYPFLLMINCDDVNWTGSINKKKNKKRNRNEITLQFSQYGYVVIIFQLKIFCLFSFTLICIIYFCFWHQYTQPVLFSILLASISWSCICIFS